MHDAVGCLGYANDQAQLMVIPMTKKKKVILKMGLPGTTVSVLVLALALEH